MTKELQKVEPVEIVTVNAAESAAILKRCEENIGKSLERKKRGALLDNLENLSIGLQIRIAAPHVPMAARGVNGSGREKGDGVAHWLKDTFNIEERTGNNYRRFADTFLLVAEAKSETVSDLGKLLPQIAQGGLNLDDRNAVDVFSTVMGEDGMIDFIDKHAPKKPKGGARKIKFTCPHCSTGNTGIIGREITCTNEKCKKKITVKPDVDPEAETKRKAEAINENAQEVVAAIVTLARSQRRRWRAAHARELHPDARRK
jgi:hypothetical protein